MIDPESPLQAVLFDVDGTLVDSERHGHRVAFNSAFEQAGLPDRWDEELYGELLKVTGGRERLEHYFAQRGVEETRRRELAEELHEVKTRYFLDLVEQGAIPARDGVRELIDELHEAGIRLGIVTTGTPDWVRALIEQHFGQERFEVVITGSDVSEKKPDPSAYQVALQRLRLDAPAVVAIEDSVPGLLAAQKAGVACVVVVNEYTKNGDFTQADLVLDGYGTSRSSAKVLANPHAVDFEEVLDARLLSRVLSSTTGERRR